MAKKQNNEQKLDALQISTITATIEHQAQNKDIPRKVFFTNLIQGYLDNFNSNPFYKKTPKKYLSLTRFYYLLGIAWVNTISNWNTTFFELCHYFHGQIMHCENFYSLNYGAMEVNASNASQMLKNKFDRNTTK